MNEPVQVKFGEWMGQGFALYRANFVFLVLAMLLLFVLSVVTLGILLPPLCAGYILITLRLLDGSRPLPGVGDIFKGFNCFLQAFLFMLLWLVVLLVGSSLLSLVPLLGQIASIFFSYAVQALLLFSLFLIAEQKMDFWTASTGSMDVVKTSFWPFLGFTFVAGFIGSLGFIVFGIGVVITAPFTFCVYSVVYRDVFGRQAVQTVEVMDDDVA